MSAVEEAVAITTGVTKHHAGHVELETRGSRSLTNGKGQRRLRQNQPTRDRSFETTYGINWRKSNDSFSFSNNEVQSQ